MNETQVNLHVHLNMAINVFFSSIRFFLSENLHELMFRSREFLVKKIKHLMLLTRSTYICINLEVLINMKVY